MTSRNRKCPQLFAVLLIALFTITVPDSAHAAASVNWEGINAAEGSARLNSPVSAEKLSAIQAKISEIRATIR